MAKKKGSGGNNNKRNLIIIIVVLILVAVLGTNFISYINDDVQSAPRGGGFIQQIIQPQPECQRLDCEFCPDFRTCTAGSRDDLNPTCLWDSSNQECKNNIPTACEEDCGKCDAHLCLIFQQDDVCRLQTNRGPCLNYISPRCELSCGDCEKQACNFRDGCSWDGTSSECIVDLSPGCVDDCGKCLEEKECKLQDECEWYEISIYTKGDQAVQSQCRVKMSPGCGDNDCSNCVGEQECSLQSDCVWTTANECIEDTPVILSSSSR